MPIFRLNEKDIFFPPVDLAEDDGLLAIGGDLSPERLIKAYSAGIFPWYNEGEEILWWSPDPRLVLYPEELHISKSMRRILNRGEFSVTFNENFEEVIKHCSQPRIYEEDTWLSEEMIKAYIELHKIGYAVSTEVWRNDKMVGGLYGLGIGEIFFGESMFFLESNASKVGMIKLTQKLEESNIKLIDCQVRTEHLISFGAKEIDRRKFIDILRKNRSHDPINIY